jgi:hypothetical protein
MTTERKPLSKTTRFEVFKRDGFKCQYCGRAAPDVLLVVDHIKPVAAGGENNILNLLTACPDCNAGKSDRALDDGSILARQRGQLEELEERRQQIEMMLDWQGELAGLKDAVVSRLGELWHQLTPGWCLNENGWANIGRMIRKFGCEEVSVAMRIAAETYLRYGDGGRVTKKSWEEAFSKISGICHARQVEKDKPYIHDLYYVRGILRNRLRYFDQDFATRLLDQAIQAGASIESLKDFAKSCRSWSNFRGQIEEFIASQS